MAGAYMRIETNAPIVRQGLQDLAADLPKIGRLVLYRTILAIFRRSGVYPPEWPGQKYRRTYGLRKSRVIERTPQGYTLSIEPVSKYGVSYGVYVLGLPTGGGQSAYHRNKWPPLAQITNEEVEKLPKEIQVLLLEAAARASARTNAK